MAITGDMLIGEVLRTDIRLAEVLMQAGMHCLGCPSAHGESIAEACEVHGIDADNLVGKLNGFLAANPAA